MAKTWVNFKEVRQTLDFDTVLSHFDLPRGKGFDFKIPCPFHDDKKPSCSVNTKKNVFHCFSCGEKGNVLDFVTLMVGGDPSNPQDVRDGALRGLEIIGESPKSSPEKLKNLGTKTRSDKKKSKKRPLKGKKKKVAESAPEAKDRQFGNKTNYESTDQKSTELKPLTFSLKLKPAHAFLRERGISSEMAERRGIGYCNRGMMKGRICFPLKRADGQLVGYSGRYVDSGGDVPEDVARYKLPSEFPKQAVLYNLDRAKENMSQFISGSHIVVVEGFWSAIKFDELGIPVVATMGGNLSEQQIALLIQAGARFITIIFDGDEAGRSGTSRALMDLSRKPLWASAVHLGDGTSPDDLSKDQILALFESEQFLRAG